MKKEWKSFGDECPRCGSEGEVLTDTNSEYAAYDGDDARCTECGLHGSVTVDDEDENGDPTAHISWFDFDEEEE